ncbi:hypothetical protein [Microbacterium aurantiacum]
MTEPQSTVVGIAAIVVAVIVIAVPLVGTVIDRAAQVSNAGA